MNHAGTIQVIYGPMFSGKSTELLRRIRRYTVGRRPCLVVKYLADTRYNEEQMSTHDRIMWKAYPCSTLAEVHELAMDYEVIGIDEGQFFPDIVSFCEDMANRGKIVIVAALDGTFQRKPFGNILELVPLAEEVTKLNSVCTSCGNDASFSKRIGSEVEVEVIGGADNRYSVLTHDRYVAICRQCYFKPAPSLRPGESPTKFICIQKIQSPELSTKAPSSHANLPSNRDEVRAKLFGQ